MAKVLGSVRKAFGVLDLFTEERPEWGVSEIARLLGLSKASAHALLCSLAEGGLLHRTPEGRYRLGWRVVHLNRILAHTAPLRSVARPVMEDLSRTYGETVHLAVLERGRVLYLDKTQGNRAIQVNITREGAYLYAHASSLGKVLLASLEEGEVREIAQTHGLPRFTPNTITHLDDLFSELERVRTWGVAYDIEEYVEELCCVGTPILDHAGQVVAALSFAVPAYRFKEMKQAYRNMIAEAGRRISEGLGFEGRYL